MKSSLFRGRESHRDEVWSFISVNVLLPLISLENGHRLLLSLEMKNYDLVVFYNSAFQKQQAVNNWTHWINNMHFFSHYFVKIFPKYWYMQSACCATHCTETVCRPISVWEDCRLNKMQDSASACRLDSTRTCRLGGTQKQWEGANHHEE